MPSVNELTAADIMTRKLITARPSQDLAEIERTMINERIGGLPVVEKGRLVGVVSRSDIARMQVLMLSLDEQVSDEMRWDDVHADGFQHTPEPEFQGFRQRIARLKVKEAMRDQVVTCAPTTPVGQIAAQMIDRHIHRVIVVEGDRPVGIVSSLDLVKILAGTR
jgi:CBS domain-containing protein